VTGAAGHAPPYVPHCRCGARWTGLSRAHCAGCHRTFSAVTAFDLHRRGGACLDPADAGLVERNGMWGQPGKVGAWWQ
jgi:hypothetical protein